MKKLFSFLAVCVMGITLAAGCKDKEKEKDIDKDKDKDKVKDKDKEGPRHRGNISTIMAGVVSGLSESVKEA